MAAREILLLGHPTLWQQSAAVLDARDRETRETIADLAATLADFRSRMGFGRAIAAPQIGVSRRIIFVNAGNPFALINPQIVWRSEEQMELWDDCFSFPDLLVRLKRNVEIKVSFLDESGAQRALEAERDLSELLQHEIDHLDGILAVDRALDRRSLCLRAALQRRAVPDSR
jgi:peptide deformylase